MCGIAAVINGTGDELFAMYEAIKRRGTHSSFKMFGNIHVGFAYLPITDEKAPGPSFRSGNYTVWLNGYISNYKELAAKYGFEPKTNCDTEVLAMFLDKFNRDKLQELNGFFAVLVYDHFMDDVWYFTDRYGIKQLYTYRKNFTTYICSEIKGIAAVQDLELTEEGIDDYYRTLGVFTDTIYKGVHRVKPMQVPVPERNCTDTFQEACIKVRQLFAQSIARNRVGEHIKTGVLLSGGIDSGMIAQLIDPDYCFSMDYRDNDYSEIENIKLNTTGIHYTMICNVDLFRKYMLLAADVMDDPKAGSCYTNYAITELASKFCTVLYSGAGGDEVFKGYMHRYDKPINEVVRRFEKLELPEVDLTHEQYDWKYLQGILVVEDRMAGNFAMETRYPFLDNDLVDYVATLPIEYLMGKRLLKNICGLHQDVISGKKKGFSNPYIDSFNWAVFLTDRIKDKHHATN